MKTKGQTHISTLHTRVRSAQKEPVTETKEHLFYPQMQTSI